MAIPAWTDEIADTSIDQLDAHLLPEAARVDGGHVLLEERNHPSEHGMVAAGDAAGCHHGANPIGAGRSRNTCTSSHRMW